jgi:hypothetical protein
MPGPAVPIAGLIFLWDDRDMPKPWDTRMAALAGALLGLLASLVHIMVERTAAPLAPIPILQVALYVIGVAAVFVMISYLRNFLFGRVRKAP